MANLRFALRMLLKTPVVTSVAVASLALGIGSNAAMFSFPGLGHALCDRRLDAPSNNLVASFAGEGCEGVSAALASRCSMQEWDFSSCHDR